MSDRCPTDRQASPKKTEALVLWAKPNKSIDREGPMWDIKTRSDLYYDLPQPKLRTGLRHEHEQNTSVGQPTTAYEENREAIGITLIVAHHDSGSMEWSEPERMCCATLQIDSFYCRWTPELTSCRYNSGSLCRVETEALVDGQNSFIYNVHIEYHDQVVLLLMSLGQTSVGAYASWQ